MKFNKETIIGLTLLVLAFVNNGLALFGKSPLPIQDENLTAIVSLLFVIGTGLYNTYKNRNITTAAQKGQEVIDAIKTGKILVEEVDEFIENVKKK